MREALMLAVAGQALVTLSRDYGSGGFARWSALVFAVLLLLALGLRGAGEWVAGGIFTVWAVVAWAVFVGALEWWFGWLPRNYLPFRGFHVGVLARGGGNWTAVATLLVSPRRPRLPASGARPARRAAPSDCDLSSVPGPAGHQHVSGLHCKR
jgi:hypothetical protein